MIDVDLLLMSESGVVKTIKMNSYHILKMVIRTAEGVCFEVVAVSVLLDDNNLECGVVAHVKKL